MKYDKKAVIKYFSGVIVLVGCVFAMEIAYNNLPKAITYETNDNNADKQAVAETYALAENEPCLYEKAADIIQPGPFIIKSSEKNICVFQDDNCLYRLNCKLSDFPESDRNVIVEGIEISDKEELLEIVSYMES